MYNVSDDFIGQIAVAGKEKDIYATIEGTSTRIIPQSFKPSFEGNLFKTVMQKFDIEVKFGDIIQNNLVFKYGLKVDNNYEYITYNTAIPYSTEINYETNIAKSVLYDNMVKFMVKYDVNDLGITFPCTMLQLVQAICTHIGVQLYSTNFYNATLSIPSDLFTALNCTYRDVLDYVCQASLTTGIIKDNKLYFKTPTNTGKTITPNMLKKLKIKEHFGGCNSFVLGRGDLNDNIYSQDQELIERDGLQEIRFDNNEIVDKRREEVIDGMFNQIKGLQYYTFDESDIGIGIFEPVDFCNMQDLDGNNYSVLVLNQSLTITSGCQGTMGSNMPSTSTTKYEYATDSQKRQTRAEIIVDKQLNEIRETVSEVSEEVVEVAEQTELNTDEIARLGSTDTVEGEELNINASNNPAKMILYGNTEQTTRSGKNIYRLPNNGTNAGITYTKNLNGTFNLEGTTTGTKPRFTFYIDANEFKKYEGKTLSLSINNKPNVAFFVSAQDYQDTTWIKELIYIRETSTSTSTSISSVIPTITGNRIRFIIQIDTTDIVTVNQSNIEVQLEDNPTPTQFEPYGVSPSPDYPARIRNVGDNINRFDINNISSVNGYLDTQGRVYSGGTRNEKTFDFMKANPNETYTFTLEETTDNTADGYWFGIGAYSNNNESSFISMPYRNTSTTKNVTFTTPAGTKYIRISGRYLAGATKLKLVEGSTIFPYTQYNCGSADYLVQNYNLTPFTFRQGGKNGAVTTTRLFTTDNFYVKADKTYTIITNLNINNYKYAINLASQSFPTDIVFYDSGWITNTSFTFTPTQDGYFGVPIAKLNGTDNLTPSDMAGYWFMLVEGTEVKPYIPHEEYTIHFPFAEGQLLHKGDYLAEDGIHQVKGTIVFDGSEDWILRTSNPNNTVTYQLSDAVVTQLMPYLLKNNTNSMSTHFIYLETVSTGDDMRTKDVGFSLYYQNGSTARSLYINSNITTLNDFKTWLSNNNVQIEYELAQEVIIPYTPEQERALDEIYTFKGNNYIYCIDEVLPEKIVLTYYPNTPYNDTLVNKDTFDKVTSNMSAEFNIRAGEIESKVTSDTTAQIITLLNNGYLTAEQVNALVNGNSEDIATVKQQLTQTVTSSEMQIAITSAIEGGVSYLKNTLFTIDEDGMWIATSQDEFNARYNNRGMYLYSYEDMIASFDVNGSVIHGNLTLEGELLTPNLRMMNTTVSGVNHTHIHWIGG